MFQSDLFLTCTPESGKVFARMTEAVLRALVGSMDHGKAYAGLPPEELRKLLQLPELLPDKGLGFEALIEELKKKVLPNMVRPDSTRCMAHLHCPALMETAVMELVIGAFNQSMDSWDQAPAATEIEVEVIRHLCRLFGYGEGSDGVFTSGGTQSNLSGLLLARDWFCREKLHHDLKRHGLPPEFRKLRIYTSELSHFSVEKSAHLMGLGYDACVKIPADERLKMDSTALEKRIAADLKAGLLPFCVAATVGTTDFGSIDPLPELRKICDKYGLWLHADAAYGSGAVLSAKYASRAAGLGQCDSITADFHKMFLMPVSCSVSLVRDAREFDTMTLHADYLNREEDEEEGYTNLVNKSMQTTRRFDALKVWFSFRMRGREEWAQIITSCIDNASFVYETLKNAPDFETAVPPELSSVVFRLLPPKGSKEDADDLNRRLRKTLMHQYGAIIGQTVWKDRVFLKFTLLNPLQTRESLTEVLELLRSLR